MIASGYAVNDWSRYPPGFVDAAEDAISWVVYATGARRQIRISAVGGAGVPAHGVSLAAEIRVNSDPVSRVPMVWHDHTWVGEAELSLPSVGPAQIAVAVLLPGFDPGAGGDVRADREAVRNVARQRLAGAGHGLGDADRPLVAAGAFLAEIAVASQDS